MIAPRECTMSRTKRMLAGLAVAGGLAGGIVGMSAPAWAECTSSPNCQEAPVVLGIQQSTPPPAVAPATAQAPSSTLPFTGTDVAELTLIGGLAVAGGAVLVRSSRRRNDIA